MSHANDDARVQERVESSRSRLAEVDHQLSDPSVASDLDRLRDLSKERTALARIVSAADELAALETELAGARELAAQSDDSDMRELAAQESRDLEQRIGPLGDQLRELLMPADPLDDRAAVVEIRAGTGGDEAGLFAGDLLRMYRRLAETAGWSVELVGMSEGIPGSIKDVTMIVRGSGAYGHLRNESGVHRVQRVPETESQGRIHTSAASVAVLPEAEEVDLEIDPSDLRIDVFRSSGPGGQSVNTTDSAVRIKHLPTGIEVSCQDEKSQLKNKVKAMKVLRSRLLDQMVAEQEAERARDRRLQIGTGDRSAKIRTYNYPQNRVTDHRIGLTLYRLNEIMDGDLAEILNALRMARKKERMESDDV